MERTRGYLIKQLTLEQASKEFKNGGRRYFYCEIYSEKGGGDLYRVTKP